MASYELKPSPGAYNASASWSARENVNKPTCKRVHHRSNRLVTAVKAHVPAVTYHLSSVRVIRVHFCTSSFCQEQRSCLCSTRPRNGHSQAGTDEELDRSPVSGEKPHVALQASSRQLSQHRWPPKAGSFNGLNAAVNVDLSVGPALVRLSLEHYQWNFGVRSHRISE